MFRVFLPPTRSADFIARSVLELYGIGYHAVFVTRLMLCSVKRNCVSTPPNWPAYDWLRMVIWLLIMLSGMLPPALVVFSRITWNTTGIVTIAAMPACGPIFALARN